MSEGVRVLEDANFQETIASGVTVVDFYADWCGPCRMIAPLIETLSQEFQGKATICKLDIEKAQETTAKFGVTSIPTIIVFREGQEVNRLVGVKDEDFLRNMITSQIQKETHS